MTCFSNIVFVLGVFTVLVHNIDLSLENVVLYNETGLSISGNVYTSYSDIETSDFSTIADKFAIQSYSQIHSSLIECAIACMQESRCDYFHFDGMNKTCFLSDMSKTDKRHNGIYDCPAGYALFERGSMKFCLIMIPSLMTRNVAEITCSFWNGNIAMLIEEEKNNAAADVARTIYTAGSYHLWIGAMMNTSDQKWYWSDGTLVDETRFLATSPNFITRDTSTPCVAFLSDKYSPYDCSVTGFTLCETDMYKI